MKISNWLIIDKNGVKGTRKNKPLLDWDEISIKLNIEIPNELFTRPTIEANLLVKDVPNNAYNPEIVLDTVDLIEQQTGARINFRVLPVEEEAKE